MFKKNNRTRIQRVPKACYFCKENLEPDYKKADQLRRYMTERGKIIGQARTGTCRKHQRRLMLEIKRARILALLPFVAKLR